MDFNEIVRRNRSYRRFYQESEISEKLLTELVDYVRLSASSGNVQGLKFILSNKPDLNAIIFKHLRWAFYLKEWNGPDEGERPAAYILILGDANIHNTIDIDVGVAAQTILLGAVSKGLGGCMIGSINRVDLRKQLDLPENLTIALVVALGKPNEKVIIEDLPDNGSVEYWRDSKGIHHVPKRSLDDLIVKR